MPKTTLSLPALNALNIDRFIPFIPECFRHFVFAPPGVAPYRLLAYLSTLSRFEGKTVVEVGVHNGWGSLALTYSGQNDIVGYDVDLSTLDPAIRALPRTTFKEGLAHELDPELLLSSPLIHLDALHDGVYEQELITFLTDRGYQGWLLLDDIHLNPQMKALWAAQSIPGSSKHDLTGIGHSTGTGLICFAGDVIDLETTTAPVYPYTAISLHPPYPDEGARGSAPVPSWECWGSFTETHPRMGAFSTDGIIGWVYKLDNALVWMNEAGHPTKAFLTMDALSAWLGTKSADVRWCSDPKGG